MFLLRKAIIGIKILKTYISIVLPIGSWLPSQAPILLLRKNKDYTRSRVSPWESLCVQRAAPPEIVARAGGLGKSPSVPFVVIPQGNSSRAKSGALVVIAQGNSNKAPSGANRQ